MPELPEVETTRRGLAPLLEGKRLREVRVRQRRLRFPVAADIEQVLAGRVLKRLERQGKYLLFVFPAVRLIIHLGMSGSLSLAPPARPPGRHDHVDFLFSKGCVLRFRDPRRFGSVLIWRDAPERHPLLAQLGPDPLAKDFHGDYLYAASRRRRVAAKQFLMNGRIVAGIGNIYAGEALFRAGIRPTLPAGSISRRRWEALAAAVREVLEEALEAGGTTLRDFAGGTGQPGYFRIALQVYGRAGQPCLRCGKTLRYLRQGQRSTVYCPVCQR